MKYPTMQEYIEAVAERLHHNAVEDLAYWVKIREEVEGLRQANAVSGIEEWTPPMTLGALWAFSSIDAMAGMLAAAGMLEENTLKAFRVALRSQEERVVALERGVG